MENDERLFGYQREHGARMYRALQYPCAIDSSDTGTGKTHTSSWLCSIMGLTPAVICPKSVIRPWFLTLANYGVIPAFVTNYEAIKLGKCYRTLQNFDNEERSHCNFVDVVETEDDTEFIWKIPPGDRKYLVVFDEAHKSRNYLTLNSKLLLGVKPLLIVGACKLLILSATICDSVETFRIAGYMLGVTQLGKHAYRTWCRKAAADFSDTLKNHVQEVVNDAINAQPADPPKRNADDSAILLAINKVVYPKFGSRMRISDIKEGFMGNDVKAEVYPVSPEIEDQIEQGHADIRNALDMLRNKEAIDGQCPLVLLLRARQRIELLKVPTFVETAQEYIMDGHSVIIFVNFSETAIKIYEQMEEFIKEFDSFITFIEGRQTVSERKFNEDAFREDRSRLLIANIQAGGVGINLHDVNGTYSRVTLISPCWSSTDLKQTLGRTHRVGAKSDAIQRIVYCSGNMKTNAKGNDGTFTNEKTSIEVLIANKVNLKLRNIEHLNNGDENDLYLI